MHVLVFNPGGGSTKVAVYRGRREIFLDNIRHPQGKLARYKLVLDQYRLRKDAVLTVLSRRGFDTGKLDAVVTRGGPLRPLPGGVYRITRRVVADIRRGDVQTMHPSLLGPLVAFELASELSTPAYFVDPESTDEFWEVARISGLNGIPRRALSHALSCRAVGHSAARKIGKPYAKCRFVIAHLGTGITVAAHVLGRQIDASNANDDGPFSTQRSGSLPISGLVKLCFTGRYSERDVLELTQRRGGLVSYLGTDDLEKVEAFAKRGNPKARLLFDSLVYQVGKEIGAYSVACRGRVDAVVLTGGLAKSKALVSSLKKWIRHLSPRLLVFPGEEETRAMVQRFLAVHEGVERERSYEEEAAVRR